MNILGRVARTLENSLAVHSPSLGGPDLPPTDYRRPPFSVGASKLLAAEIDTFVWRHRHLSEIVLDGLAKRISDIRYLGNGAHASVYRRQGEVLKVYRQTVHMSEAERSDWRDTRQALCDTLQAHLGNLVAPQRFSIGNHPLGDYRAVLGNQPYVAGSPLVLFTTNSLRLNEADVAAHCETHGTWDLHELVEGTFRSDDRAGIVPDLNGNDNFRVTRDTGALRLIDAEPIHRKEHPLVHSQILRQALLLDAFITS